MNHTKIYVEPFYIIGLAIRTTNENGQSAIDIPQLWNRFLSENIIGQIPNKTDENIYCVYTDYESDYTKPYTTILGCKVDHINDIPDGLIATTIADKQFIKFTAAGKLSDGVVFQEWTKIWNTDLNRAYKADFEVYGIKAQDPNNAEIEIFIAVN